MSSPPPYLYALLESPPEGVAVTQGMDRVEIRLRKVPPRRMWAYLGLGLLAVCGSTAASVQIEPMPRSLLGLFYTLITR